MRFFTRELLININDSNGDIRAQAENKWNKNDKDYQQQFLKVKKHLSKAFVKELLARKGMHDYSILGIDIDKGTQTYSCELRLSNGDETVVITMERITSLQMELSSLCCCIQGSLAWGYSEFEITPDKQIRLSVLCDEENEMQFEFKTIQIKRQEEGSDVTSSRTRKAFPWGKVTRQSRDG